MDVEAILEKQKAFFATGKTLDVAFRKQSLKKLKNAITEYEDKLCKALSADLGKSRSESYMTEIGLVKSEITYMLRHVGKFVRERRVATPMSQYVSRSFEKPSPYGSVLIASPWNYPVLLTLEPLVDALAAGNTAVVKPSAYSPHTTAVMQELLEHCFPPEYVAVVTGGRQENQLLFSGDFDYIFFTGSSHVGKVVLEQAAQHLTPVTLELGGKSPCIVDETANLPLTARRIVFGKFVNCGQTCVAPDYILCHASVKDRLIGELKREIETQYGKKPLENDAYGKIVNEKHFSRLLSLIDREKVVYGGETAGLRIAPTILDNVTWEDAVMGQEIFGPILPILTYTNMDEAIAQVRRRPEPLALYIFSSNKQHIQSWLSRVSFGGGCVNDTLIHLATSNLGFGGVGASGMGAYHGKKGFDTFTHYKSIVDKKTFLDLPMRYQPYATWKDKLVRMFVK